MEKNSIETRDTKSVEERVFSLLEQEGSRSGLAATTKKFLGLMEEHDRKTFLHECRVALIAMKLAEFCGFKDQKPELFGGANHDVGKLTISGELLGKGHITQEEYEIIKKHADASAKMLAKYPFTAYISGSHHSQQKNSYGVDFKGAGLPDGVKEATEKRMQEAAKNVALADFFDAASTRKTSQMGGENDKSPRERMEAEYPDYLDRIDFLFGSQDVQEIVGGKG